MDGQASEYASGEFYAADPRYLEDYLRSVAQVTGDDLNAMAAIYLRPGNRTVAVLKPEPVDERGRQRRHP